MKLRWKILAGLAVVAGITLLAAVVHHFQLKTAVERYKAELRAKGEPMELAQVIPPPVPPEQNSAALFLKAVSLFNTNDILIDNPPPAMHGVAYGKAMVGWEQPEIRSPEGTNSWEEVKAALNRSSEAFNLLFRITNSAQFDFNLDYDQHFEMRLAHLSPEKKTAQKLSANALLALHSGDTGLAATNIRTMLRLVNGTQDERTAISQLVRIAIAQIAAAATWELLQAPDLSDEQLADLQTEWNRLEFVRAAENFFPVEREGCEANLAEWRSSNSKLRHYLDLAKQVHAVVMGDDEESPEDSIWKKAKTKAQIFLWRYWWSYQDELRYLKGCEALMSTTRTAEANGSFQTALTTQSAALDQLGISGLNNSFDSLFSGKTDFHSMLSESIVTLGGVIRKVMRVEVTKQTVTTAIALKRYQLKHRSYPHDLNALVPEFVSAVPLDPVDGQPLRYRPNADGTYLLYSVGANGADDGGNPALEKYITGSNYNWQNDHALDWVWPQPATTGEIQKYYAEQAKKGE